MTNTADTVTLKAAAEATGRSVVTLRQWVRLGLIRVYRRPLDKRFYVSLSEIRALQDAEPRLAKEPGNEQDT